MAETRSGVVYHEPVEVTYKSKGNYFTLRDVRDRGKVAVYDFLKEMYPQMHFGDFFNRSAEDEEAERPHGASAPLHIALMQSGLRGSGKDEFRTFLYGALRGWPQAWTAVDFTPEGQPDRVVHNVGSRSQYILEGNFVGPNLWIRDADGPTKKTLKAIFGIGRTKTLDKISQSINGTNSYFWRRNSPQKQTERSVARFSANGDRLDLNCDRYPLVGYPAFRVLQTK